MNHSSNINDDEPPLDPAAERVRQKLARMQSISIGIMVVGLMAVFGAIVYKINAGNEESEIASPQMSVLPVPSSANYIGNIDLPEGAEVLSSSLDGSHILLHIKLSSGNQQMILYDITSGRQFGAINIK